MNYIDLHCDALTKEGAVSVCGESLKKGGCMLQCFAAFVDGTKGEGFARAISLCDKFDAMCAREHLRPVRRFEAGGGTCAMLTVEGGEALGGKLGNLAVLFARGVKMLGLTWNCPNALGGSALLFPPAGKLLSDSAASHTWRPLEGELPPAERAAEGVSYGLTPFGRECVEEMCALGMLPDVSHGSDALVRDVSAVCRRRGKPFVASHSNARAVFSHPRNLTDEGIRLVAESGGVVGLNFFAKFLSRDESREGQKAALLAHARHMLRVGGEDALALGSDFDGAPASPYVGSPAAVCSFLAALEKAFGARVAEKIAYANAARVLSL